MGGYLLEEDEGISGAFGTTGRLDGCVVDADVAAACAAPAFFLLTAAFF